jgi:hypothetical protein
MALILAVLRYGQSCSMVHPKTILFPGSPHTAPRQGCEPMLAVRCNYPINRFQSIHSTYPLLNSFSSTPIALPFLSLSNHLSLFSQQFNVMFNRSSIKSKPLSCNSFLEISALVTSPASNAGGLSMTWYCRIPSSSTLILPHKYHMLTCIQ